MALSELCDTTSNYIGQIEMGRRIPSFEKIEKIAKALKVEPCHLFMCEETIISKDQKIESKDYLNKMPGYIKKELVSRLMAGVKSEILKALNPGKK